MPTNQANCRQRSAPTAPPTTKIACARIPMRLQIVTQVDLALPTLSTPQIATLCRALLSITEVRPPGWEIRWRVTGVRKRDNMFEGRNYSTLCLWLRLTA